MRIACDSLVALQATTSDGSVVFAKNSDRPALEPQPLLRVPRCRHAIGATLPCTYIEVPQVRETACVLGSRPDWCWGFEHGLNEHGVAIGNHSVYTKDSLPGRGLIGMDLVRLGLERGRTVDEALAVITGLLENYGQGGSGYRDLDWPYHNSFLVADREGAVVLETSGRHWAVRRVADVAAASNHVTIAQNWERLSPAAVEHAVAMGWWPADADARFDFAGAYRDTSVVPAAVSSGRLARTCTLLADHRGRISVEWFKSVLRDHNGCPLPRGTGAPTEPGSFTVCMHTDPVGTTTASVIARIPPTAAEPLQYWASLGSPCVGAFVPLYLDVELPTVLTRGGTSGAANSAWWRCHRLLAMVEENWVVRFPRVRQVFDRFEMEIAAEMTADHLATASLPVRSGFVERAVTRMLRLVEQLIVELS